MSSAGPVPKSRLTRAPSSSMQSAHERSGSVRQAQGCVKELAVNNWVIGVTAVLAETISLAEALMSTCAGFF